MPTEENALQDLVAGTGVTVTKPDLTTEQKNYKQCEVARYVADHISSEKKFWADRQIEELNANLCRAGLAEEKILLQYIKRGVNEHNGKIEANRKRLRNLSSSGKWWESVLLRGCDFSKITKLVVMFQHEDAYDIYKFYFGEGKLIKP